MPFRLANVAGRAALVRHDPVRGDCYHDLESVSGGSFGSDPMAALGRGDELTSLSAALDGSSITGTLADRTLDAPVPRPSKSFGIGLNYRAHAAESQMEIPESPLVFSKYPSCLTGPTGNVELRSDGCDYEAELVAVIGKKGKDISTDAAWDHVVGLTAGQDISDRPAQFMAKPPQFGLGKSFDTFGPIGPVLVSTDSFDDPSRLGLTCSINGEQRQNGHTRDLIFDVATLVSLLSHITTLEVGDIIFTGTPEGVGFAAGTFLVDGDVITTTVEGIGTMTNRCVRVGDYR